MIERVTRRILPLLLSLWAALPLWAAEAVVRSTPGDQPAAAAVCEAVCRPFHVSPPLYRRRVAFFTKDRSFDTSKIRDRLGFTPKFTSEEGLAQTARWYKEHGWL